jgi:hypothetical protein
MENYERYLTIKRYLLGEVDEHKAHMRQAMKDNNHVGYEHAEDRIHYLTHLINNLKDDLHFTLSEQERIFGGKEIKKSFSDMTEEEFNKIEETV